MGESWHKGDYEGALLRIKSEINLGVNRLAHLTVLGLNFDDHKLTPELNDDDRLRVKELQDEIFECPKPDRPKKLFGFILRQAFNFTQFPRHFFGCPGHACYQVIGIYNGTFPRLHFTGWKVYHTIAQMIAFIPPIIA